jgi:hypothetical protein
MYTKLSTLIAAVCLGAFAATLGAQDPVKLPAVVVKAAPPPPGRNIMVGVVRDTFAIPIDSVEVTIPVIKRRMMSAPNGEFRFDKVPPGEYEVRARKIGYAPQARKFTVNDSGGTGAFELVPFAVGLQPVITSAARGGLSGVVGDTAFHAIAHAEVRMAGHDLVTETDSMGAFFLPARAGKYMVHIHRDGYADRMLAITIPSDSGRRLMATLLPEHMMPIQWKYNVAELSDRLARRTNMYSSFLTRDDLLEKKIEWIYDAVIMTADARRGVDRGCMVTKNGGPDFVPLDELTVDDIESVEIYKPSTPIQRTPPKPVSKLTGKKGVADSKPMVPLDNRTETLRANWGKFCPLVYVWTR